MKSKRIRATSALAKKLLAIRLWKGLSQEDMLKLVEPDIDITQRARISHWETAQREPFRQTLIRYAQIAEISLEELLLDERQLPERITGIKVSPSSDSSSVSETNSAPDDSEKESVVSATSGAGKSAEMNTENDSHFINRAEPSDNMDKEDEDISLIDETNAWMISDEESEKVTLYLASDLLDDLDDVRVELLNQLPRRYREFLDLSSLVTICCWVLLSQHERQPEKSILVRETKRFIDGLS